MRAATVLAVVAGSILQATAAPLDATIASALQGDLQFGNVRFTCDILEKVLGKTVVFKANSPGYSAQEQVNYSPTCWLPAACFVSPQNVAQVSAVVQVLGALKTKFSIRSGGKNLNPGVASVGNSGVLVSLANITTLSLSADQKTVNVGAGLNWDVVYDFVVPKGLVVVGSRYTKVGVSGFLLGGGISFYTNQYGLGIDNIKSFTVVVADGRVLKASAMENADLYKALKGGNSNFGIVVNFELYAHPMETLFWEIRGYGLDASPAVLEAYADFQLGGMLKDPKARVDINIWTDGPKLIMLYNGPKPSPGVFDAFLNLTVPHNELYPAQSGTYQQLQQIQEIRFIDPHVHNYGETFSHKIDKKFMVDIEKYFLELMIEPTAKYENFTYLWVPVAMPAAMMKGDNVLGLEPVEQQWHEWMIQWVKDEDNDAMIQLGRDVTAKLMAFAEGHESDALLPYIFMNTAGSTQEVLQSFGEKNVAFIKKVAKKYDPFGTFQLQNDGWLLRDV